MTFFRSSHRRSSVRKGILRNFTKFIGKTSVQTAFVSFLNFTSQIPDTRKSNHLNLIRIIATHKYVVRNFFSYLFHLPSIVPEILNKSTNFEWAPRKSLIYVDITYSVSYGKCVCFRAFSKICINLMIYQLYPKFICLFGFDISHGFSSSASVCCVVSAIFKLWNWLKLLYQIGRFKLVR